MPHSILVSSRYQAFALKILVVLLLLILSYSSPCGVKREHRLASKRFETEYLGKQPVIIEAARSIYHASNKLNWMRDGFIDRYGDIETRLVDRDELLFRGSRAREVATVSVREYATSMDAWKLPLFENSQEKLSLAVSADINFQPLVVRRLRLVRVISLGSANTSIGFHAHGQNFLAQVHGRKAWLLSKPDDGRPDIEDPCQYQSLFDQERSKSVKHCVLHPGEMLYVPSNWWHATCNLDDWTFAFGGEGDISGFPAAHVAVIDNDMHGLRQAVETEGRAVLDQPGCVVDCFFLLLKGTPVHIATGHSNLAMLQVLSDMGADLQKDLSGVSTPLHVAAVAGNISILEWLVHRGTPVDLADMDGMTALHHASHFGRLDVIQWLCQQSPSIIDLRDSGGDLPIHVAANSGQEDATQLLLSLKPSHSDTRNAMERTAFDLAAAAGHARVARILQGHSEL